MKPEEFDNIIRKQIEELKEAPDLNWDQENGWKKINNSLTKGWITKSILPGSIIGVVALITLLTIIFSTKPTIPVTKIGHKNISNAIAISNNKNLTIDKKEKNLSGKGNKLKRRSVQVTGVDSTVIIQSDSVQTTVQLPDKEKIFTNYNIPAKNNFSNRSSFAIKNKKYTNQSFKLNLPSQQIWVMDAQNSFNIKNFIKSSGGFSDKSNIYYYYKFREKHSFTPHDPLNIKKLHKLEIHTNFHEK